VYFISFDLVLDRIKPHEHWPIRPRDAGQRYANFCVTYAQIKFIALRQHSGKFLKSKIRKKLSVYLHSQQGPNHLKNFMLLLGV
jgi:hypothetical protein